MPSTFSSRINALTFVAQHLESTDAVAELTLLRKQSDIMEIIGHPRNPANAGIRDAASFQFDLFHTALKKVQMAVLNLVEAHSDRDTATYVGKVCFGDQADQEKLAILTDYLETNVPKAEASPGIRP